jgi:hypothetical protein
MNKQQRAWARLNSLVDIATHQAAITKGQFVASGHWDEKEVSELEPAEVIKKLRVELIELLKERETAQTLIAKQDRVMAAIPPCPAHGYLCVKNALEWIAKAKTPSVGAVSVAQQLKTAVRQGAKIDEPEGARFIVISDTLAADMIKDLLEPIGDEQ